MTPDGYLVVQREAWICRRVNPRRSQAEMSASSLWPIVLTVRRSCSEAHVQSQPQTSRWFTKLSPPSFTVATPFRLEVQAQSMQRVNKRCLGLGEGLLRPLVAKQLFFTGSNLTSLHLSLILIYIVSVRIVTRDRLSSFVRGGAGANPEGACGVGD